MSLQGAEPSDRAVPEQGRHGRGRAVLTLLGALTLLSLLGIWAAAAAVTAYSAGQDLQEARADMAMAERQLRDAELSASRETLDRAVEGASAASDKLHQPHVVPLRWLPMIGTNLRAATVLSDTARDTGVAAADLLDAAAVIVGDDRSQEAGEISLAYLSELAPPARELADTLVRTTADVEALNTAGLIGRIAEAREEYLELSEAGTEQAVLAADLLEVMPAFLGEDEPRSYLVGAAALSEIRASGGLLGSWSILRTDDGLMTVDDFVDTDELTEPSTDVTAPSEEYQERYARYDALRQYRNANLTPDFPASAQVLASLWEEGGGVPIDGVIMADTVVFERLAERSGGLEVPDVGVLQADETLEFVGVDAYDTFDTDEERKLVLGGVATAAFGEMFEILEDDDVPATVEMLAGLAEGGHLRIYTRDASVQEVFDRAGLGGELPTVPGESVGVFVNNVGGNKLDWFATRQIDHHVRLLADGQTRSTTTVTIGNDAPTEGYGRVVLGPWTDLTEAGDNLSMVTFTCSVSCLIVGEPEGTGMNGTERGRPMRDTNLLIPPGEVRELRYETESADAWWFEDDRLVLDVQHLVQPTLHGSELTVRVTVPRDTSLLEAPPGAEEDDTQVVHTGVASGVVQQRYVFDGSALEVEASDE